MNRGRKPKGLRAGLLWMLMGLVALGGCGLFKLWPKPSERFVKVSPKKIPRVTDDLQGQGLERALEQSLVYLNRVRDYRPLEINGRPVSKEKVRDTVLLFLELLRQKRLNERTLAQEFDWFTPKAASRESSGMLITGYFEPILMARRQPDENYRYPIYEPPPDLIRVALERFPFVKLDPSGVRTLVGRVEGRLLVPYYSRKEIDGGGALKAKGTALAWLGNPFDVFTLHIQGSGLLQFEDGSQQRVGYAASNGHPYVSVGKVLMEEGAIPKEEMSMQRLRQYFAAHPERTAELLGRNPSYIFFRWVDEGPVGSLNVPLTAGRSVALDGEIYPKAIVGFLEGTLPAPRDNATLAIKPLSRWVVHQDSGGAIRGLHRLDLFCGTGASAERVAGHLKAPGTFYLLLKKEPPPSN
ncbi:membrane-bound lytic murein transglycosylase A [Desulfosoma caldarium]|uniref:peptidoglycan lytic exotransglycosylase n=1 Tax=Desulfosoma caldarium TaxID=610254 RepID=A0A3N1VMZ2_9BACT|nr:membrane-bound lytic murein transglycosylase A [Desulfosoma caldarium]